MIPLSLIKNSLREFLVGRPITINDFLTDPKVMQFYQTEMPTAAQIAHAKLQFPTTKEDLTDYFIALKQAGLRRPNDSVVGATRLSDRFGIAFDPMLLVNPAEGAAHNYPYIVHPNGDKMYFRPIDYSHADGLVGSEGEIDQKKVKQLAKVVGAASLPGEAAIGYHYLSSPSSTENDIMNSITNDVNKDKISREKLAAMAGGSLLAAAAGAGGMYALNKRKQLNK